jgi:predicted transcriptional regulator
MVISVVPDADGYTDDRRPSYDAGDDRRTSGGVRSEAEAAYDSDNLRDSRFTGRPGLGAGVLAGGAGRGRRRSPGSLEAEILTVLHSARRELSPAQVRERLNGGPALSYSAVVTTLTRLHGKGVVTRRRAGRAFLYVAKSDAASLVAWRMNRLLDEQADHRPALTHFVAALSPGDEALIRQLLADGPRDGHADGSVAGLDEPAGPGAVPAGR